MAQSAAKSKTPHKDRAMGKRDNWGGNNEGPPAFKHGGRVSAMPSSMASTGMPKQGRGGVKR